MIVLPFFKREGLSMRSLPKFYAVITSLSLIGALASLSACSKNSSAPAAAAPTTSSAPVEDTSASGAAAGAVGGALSSSGSGGSYTSVLRKPENFWANATQKLLKFIPDAFASTACPTFATTGAGCATSSTNMWLTYSDCSFGSSLATWTGFQLIAEAQNTGAVPSNTSCGTFPNPGDNNMLIRQMVTNGTNSTTPATLSRTNAFGTVTTIDHSTANLANFNSDSITANIGSGYGTVVGFNGTGKRNSLEIETRIHSTGRFDHSISTQAHGSLTINETSSSERTVSGELTVYHNLLEVIGTSTFNSVVHEDGCCVPVSGNITTTFAAGGVGPTVAGSAYVGQIEVLTFTGCGTGSLQTVSGSTVSVILSNCF